MPTSSAPFRDRATLLQYYERELRCLRTLGAEFGKKHPAVARRLSLEDGRCDDPHVERLIEAVALLTSRVQMRLDEDFPLISDNLLEVLLPQMLAPIPSLAVVQMALGGDAPVRVPRHTTLRSRPVRETRCQFRTCYDVELWPLSVQSVEVCTLDAARIRAPGPARSALRIEIQSQARTSLADLPLERLCFFIDGDAPTTSVLYELLVERPLGLVARASDRQHAPVLPPERIRPMGLVREESLFGMQRRSSAGHRLLLEFFALPDKFMFVEFSGLAEARQAARDRLELLVLLDRPADELRHLALGPATLKLGCTPAENLFSMLADPVSLRATETDHEVVPDARARDHYEVHAVEEVRARSSDSGAEVLIPAFYSLQHGYTPRATTAWWHATRTPASADRNPETGDAAGTATRLSVVDRDLMPVAPAAMEVLLVRALCSNRGLAASDGLPWGDDRDFTLEKQPEVRSVRCLRRPTKPLRRELASVSRWQLVSLLSLNHLSLAGEVGGASDDAIGALHEMLALFDCQDTEVTRRWRQSIVGIEASRTTRVLPGIGPVRGLEIRTKLDRERLAGTSPLLFGAILDQFLGLQASVNSLVQTATEMADGGRPRKTWNARLGGKAIL